DSLALIYYQEALQLQQTQRLPPNQLLGTLYNNMAYSYEMCYIPYHPLNYYQKAVETWNSVPLDQEGQSHLVTGYQNLIFGHIAYGDLRPIVALKEQL